MTPSPTQCTAKLGRAVGPAAAGRRPVYAMTAAQAAPTTSPPRCACQAMPGMTKPRTALMPMVAYIAAADRPSRFIRAMILPRALLGKSSIQYVNEDDKARPKSQSYRVYVDMPITRDPAG